MKMTRKILSILLSVLLLGSVMGLGVQAAAPVQKASALEVIETALVSFLKKQDLANLDGTQIKWLINTLTALQKGKIDYTKLLDAVSENLSFAVKAALHEAGLASYPIWERDVFYHYFFKYILFGWLWM